MSFQLKRLTQSMVRKNEGKFGHLYTPELPMAADYKAKINVEDRRCAAIDADSVERWMLAVSGFTARAPWKRFHRYIRLPRHADDYRATDPYCMPEHCTDTHRATGMIAPSHCYTSIVMRQRWRDIFCRF